MRLWYLLISLTVLLLLVMSSDSGCGGTTPGLGWDYQDMDSDGVRNGIDGDVDGDGVANGDDLYPLNPYAW